MKFLLFIILIAVLTLLNIGRSLNFSLAGDDWAALYYHNRQFDSFFSYFQLSRYLGMYDFSFILMGVVAKFFSFNPFPYYLFSLIIRTLTTISFYPAIFSLTKDKRAAYLTCILFTFAYGGIESTNWVFNMATYVSIGFFNLFLWQYFKNLNTQNFKLFLLELFFLFASFYAAPNRMASILIIVPILEIITLRRFNLLSLINKFESSSFKRSFQASLIKRYLRIVLLLSPIVAFHLATATESDKTYASMLPNLSLSNSNIIFYFFSNIGSSLIPDRIFQLFLRDLSIPTIYNLSVFITHSFWVILIFVILIYLLSLSLIKKTPFLISGYSLMCAYTLIFWLSLQGGIINEFGNLLTFLNALIGGYTVITFSLYFIYTMKNYPQLSRTGLGSLFAAAIFLLPSWLVFTDHYRSEHRYLLIPTASLIIFISVFSTILTKYKNKILSTLNLLIIISIILMNFLSLQSYFNDYLSKGRMAEDPQKYFEYLKGQILKPNNNAPMVFLFLADDPLKLYNSITFGFPYHMMLTDNRFGLDVQKAPFAVDNFESLVDVVSSENSSELKRYGYKPVKIPLENVYFFKFENEHLANVTEEGRSKLIEKLPLKKVNN